MQLSSHDPPSSSRSRVSRSRREVVGAMLDRVMEQVVGLVRRLARHLNRRISEILLLLFNHKSAGLAGFALAVVFTWKFLRSPPGGPRKTPRKRRSSPSTSSGLAAAIADASGSEAYAPGLRLKDVDVIDEIGSSAELTVGQIVRRKLGGCRKMTCQLLGVIFEERTAEELQKHATVRLCVVEVLLEISKLCDIYLMETVLDDESEARVLSALESAGLFQTGGLIKEKVLFCSTENGRTSFVRQLEADWHVDTNLEIVSQLARFIRCQLYVSPTHSGQIGPNIFTSTSLEQYFSCL